MSKYRGIPVSAAKELAKKYGKDQVIIVAWDKLHGKEHVTTYGATVDDCTMAAMGGNRVKAALGWPESLRSPLPARTERLRPMSEAPTTGPVVEVLVATTDRAGCRGWLIAHYADGGGEDQPRFRGWFYWTGFDFRQLDERTLLGWLPLPSPPDKVVKR